MTQLTSPENGGVHPIFNTLPAHGQAAIDPEDTPDFLNPVSTSKSIVKERDPAFKVSKELIDPDYTHLKSKIDRTSKSEVTTGDPDFVDPNAAAEEASDRAWQAVLDKKKEPKNEISNNDSNTTGNAVTPDERLDSFRDSKYPVLELGTPAVAHEAQIDLTQHAAVPAQTSAKQ